MSVPPQTLRIKRQRDEAPVDTLFIEPSSKKQSLARAQTYFFRRVIDESTPPPTSARQEPAPTREHNETAPVTNNGIPQVLATKPGDENKILKTGSGQQSLERHAKYNHGNVGRLQQSQQEEQAQQPQTAKQPRRFHISARKSTNKLARNDSSNSLNGDRRSSSVKRKQAGNGAATVVVFEEERSARRPRLGNDGDVTPATLQAGNLVRETARIIGDGRGSRTIEKPTQTGRGSILDDSATVDPGPDTTDIDMDDTPSADDYIFDTFIRQTNPSPLPLSATNIKGSSTMDTYSPTTTPLTSIGYLIISDAASADFWFSDSDDDADKKADGDWDSEQDDENAENYYAADYPDEEEAEDEDAYRGKAGWRSQEFADEEREGEAWSGDEEEEGYGGGGYNGHERHGAEKRFQAWRRSRKGGRDSSGDDDDEDEDPEGEDEADESQVVTASPSRPKYQMGEEEEEDVRESFQTMLSYMGRTSNK